MRRALVDALAGAISGGISRTVTSPLDVIKIRFQVFPPKSALMGYIGLANYRLLEAHPLFYWCFIAKNCKIGRLGEILRVVVYFLGKL